MLRVVTCLENLIVRHAILFMREAAVRVERLDAARRVTSCSTSRLKVVQRIAGAALKHAPEAEVDVQRLRGNRVQGECFLSGLAQGQIRLILFERRQAHGRRSRQDDAHVNAW